MLALRLIAHGVVHAVLCVALAFGDQERFTGFRKAARLGVTLTWLFLLSELGLELGGVSLLHH